MSDFEDKDQKTEELPDVISQFGTCRQSHRQ